MTPSRLNTATPVKCCNMSCITHSFSVLFDSMGLGLCGAGGYVIYMFLSLLSRSKFVSPQLDPLIVFLKELFEEVKA